MDNAIYRIFGIIKPLKINLPLPTILYYRADNRVDWSQLSLSPKYLSLIYDIIITFCTPSPFAIVYIQQLTNTKHNYTGVQRQKCSKCLLHKKTVTAFWLCRAV